jgi:hypothetical protein
MHTARLLSLMQMSPLYLQAAAVNLQGGWPPPSPPAIAINVQNYSPFEIRFAFAAALQTTRVQTTPGTTLRGTAEHTSAIPAVPRSKQS